MYKKDVILTVDVQLQAEDKELRDKLQMVAESGVGKFFDWTYKHISNKTSGLFHITHMGFLKIAFKVAGHISSDDHGIYGYASSKDLHLSTVERDGLQIYDKMSKRPPKYFFMRFSETLFDDFLHEFLRKRRMTDIRKTLDLFMELHYIKDYMKLDLLEMLIPDISEDYGGSDLMINGFLNAPYGNDDPEIKHLLDT